jgi:hypothetical protein
MAIYAPNIPNPAIEAIPKTKRAVRKLSVLHKVLVEVEVDARDILGAVDAL